MEVERNYKLLSYIRINGRTPLGLNKGPWTREEDLRLRNYIEAHGEGGWRIIPKKAALLRCGKSCRLRWMNYLRPDVKCGHILPEEEDLILRLHRLLGNRWALIAGRIPGRTDNEIKNYWNTHLSKKLISQGLDPRTHKHLSESQDKASITGDRKITSQKSQRENNSTISARNISESRDDLQAAPSKGGAAIAAHGNENYDREATKWSANNGNQLPETSKTCHPQPASVAINCSPQISGISSTPYPFQEGTFYNNNMGSKQIPYPPLTPTGFDSLAALRGKGRYDLEQHLIKNPVTSSNDMIKSTLRLSSGLQAAPYVGKFDSNDAFTSANALPCKEKHQMSLQASDVPVSCVVPDEVTAISYPDYTSPTSMAATLGDFNSDIFHMLLESVVNEELQFQEHTSIDQNVQLCPLSQPEAANLTDDLWSILLSPSSQYYPSGFHK